MARDARGIIRACLLWHAVFLCFRGSIISAAPGVVPRPRQREESGKGGLYFPQNREYVNTTALVKEVAHCHHKRIAAIPGFGWLLKKLEGRISLVDKVFGSLTYDQRMSDAFRPEEELDFVATIKQTEGVE